MNERKRGEKKHRQVYREKERETKSAAGGAREKRGGKKKGQNVKEGRTRKALV